MYKRLLYWATTSAVITLMSGMVYAAVQQNFRQTANDPQIQISEDMVGKLATGTNPNLLISPEKIDLARSLSPFVIVYDKDKKVIASNGQLNGQTPSLPDGVLDAAKQSQSRLTWQPSSDVREAAVITYFNGKESGWVLAARSLREVENRESKLTLQVFGIWALAIVISFFGFVLLPQKIKK